MSKTDRDLIQKLNQENKKFRQTAKALKDEQAKVTGSALLISFASAVEMQGVYLERAVLSCDMTMGIACAQISASDILNDFGIKTSARDLFRRAAQLQKSLMPFAETHSGFIGEDLSYLDPEKVTAYLLEMDKASPILAEAEVLNDYCISWRHNFAEKQNGLLETQ